MPDFSVRLSAVGPFPVALRNAPWVDPAIANDPTRLNVRADVQHRYYQVLLNGNANALVDFRCTVGGVDGPADGALGGRLFTWSMSLVPRGAPEPAFIVAGGFTSRSFLNILALYPGHYRILAKRPGCGSIALPFDIELVP